MKSLTTVLVALGGLLLSGTSAAETVTPSAEVYSEPELRPLSQRSSFDMRLALRQSTPNGFRINGVGIASSSPRCARL